MTNADTLIASAAAAVAHINDPRDRLAAHVGYLSRELRVVCGRLEMALEDLESLRNPRYAEDIEDDAAHDRAAWDRISRREAA